MLGAGCMFCAHCAEISVEHEAPVRACVTNHALISTVRSINRE